MSVAIGLTIEAMTSTCEADISIKSCSRTNTLHIALTNIAVYVELDIAIVGPYDCLDGSRKELEKEPKAQGRDAEVPPLSHEARQEHEDQHDGRYQASDGVERVCRVKRAHGVA